MDMDMDMNIMDRSNSNQLGQELTNEFDLDVQNTNQFNNAIDDANNQKDFLQSAESNPFAKAGIGMDFGLALDNAADNDFFKRNGKRGADVLEDDLGPETDIDTVDDVAMALEEVPKEVVDLEIQRSQTKEFDGNGEARGETPTPPADAVLDNVAESDSEDEWNYYTGKQAAPTEEVKSSTEVTSEPELDEDMMASQLNPDAAEFVPISPTRSPMRSAIIDSLLDEVIAQSPRKVPTSEIDNYTVPAHFKEFDVEACQRPSELRSDSALSEESFQEMNAKEILHQNEKNENENGLDENDVIKTPLSELNPFTESFKPQDPMFLPRP